MFRRLPKSRCWRVRYNGDMSDERVTIARYYTVHEAELARMKLEAHGIDSVVHGGTNAMMSFYQAAPTVVLEVAVRDVERATPILAEGGEKSDADEDRAKMPYREATVDEQDELQAKSKNEEAAWKREASGDADAARAFRGAVLGLLFCPGPMHAYVLWQLRNFDAGQAGPKGRRQAIIARIICFAAFALLLFAWRYASRD